MRIMLDLNVLLDYAQKREPFYTHSKIVISEVLKKNAIGFLPGHAVTTLYYLVSKHIDKQKADAFTDWLLQNFEIAATEKPAFIRARTLVMPDFEDAVVASLAQDENCDFIISRNISDFTNSPVPALMPEAFVRQFVRIDCE